MVNLHVVIEGNMTEQEKRMRDATRARLAKAGQVLENDYHKAEDDYEDKYGNPEEDELDEWECFRVSDVFGSYNSYLDLTTWFDKGYQGLYADSNDCEF